MGEQKVTNNIKIPNKNFEKLKRDFPQCFDKNGNFDFEKFKKELSESKIDFSKESYGMDWLGKSYARLLATDEATTLLKENEEWNKKEVNKYSQNLLIKGDNLEVLKHLSNAYYEKIKMIYIDPPYNTGSDGFVYQDDRKFTYQELSKLAGIDEEKAKRILDFVNSKSNSHSAWLTFMYPRLYIARQLLRQDGVIFVSIDDNEVAQLRILMDEIFGEENFVAQFPRSVGTVPKTTSGIQDRHDYVLCFVKDSKDSFGIDEDISEEHFKFDDNDGRGKYALIHPLDSGTIRYSKSLDFQIKYNGKTFEPGQHIKNKPKAKWLWRWSEELVKWAISNNLIKEKNNRLYTKNYRNLKIEKIGKNYALVEKQVGKPFTSDTLMSERFGNRIATREINELLGGNYFDHPKPTNLIKILISMIRENKNSIILDFFAGSGTTGDAVMQLNAEDGGNRKYILVQLAEPIDEKKNKTAYDFVKDKLGVENPTIFEITKERLIRSAKKIKEETINKKVTEKEKEIKKLQEQLDLGNNEEKIEQLKEEIESLKNQDLGFKIFETTPIWEDYNFEAEEFNPKLELFDESKLTEEDIKTLLTTWKTYDGIPLTEDLKEIDLNGYKGYYFGTKLYLMYKGFKTENLKKLLEEVDKNSDFNPATIIAFGYNFESKALREIAENVKNYANKKQIDIDFIIRY